MAQQPSGSSAILEAVGDLWALALMVVIAMALVMFRTSLNALLQRLTRFKWGNKEIVAEPAGSSAQAVTHEDVAQAAAAGDAGEDDEERRDPDHPLFLMLMAFHERRFDDAHSAYEKLQKSAASDQERINNEALYLAQRHQYAADDNAITAMKALSERQGPGRGQVLYWLGVCYQHSKDYTTAVAIFREAMRATESNDDRARFAAAASECITKTEGGSEAFAFLTQQLAGDTTDQGKIYLYQAIASVAETLEDNTMRALALEKIVELKPADVSARFDAAFVQSEASLSYMSVSNYNTVLRFRRDHSAALNNLAVAYQELGIKTRAIALYRKAAEMDNTLAMANIAFRYLSQGFTDDAHSILETARQKNDPHPNVGSAMAAVAESKDSDERASREAGELGDRQQRFMRSYADAYFLQCDKRLFPGTWVDPDGIRVEIKQEQDMLVTGWSDDRVELRLAGTVYNRSAKTALTKTSQRATLLGSYLGDAKEEGFAYVTTDGTELHLLTSPGKTGRFLRFRKVE